MQPTRALLRSRRTILPDKTLPVPPLLNNPVATDLAIRSIVLGARRTPQITSKLFGDQTYGR